MSENLINILHAFGFCCLYIYEEARRYQWSALFGNPHSLIMMMHLFSLSLTMLTTTSSLSMDMAPFIVREYKVCHPQI